MGGNRLATQSFGALKIRKTHVLLAMLVEEEREKKEDKENEKVQVWFLKIVKG